MAAVPGRQQGVFIQNALPGSADLSEINFTCYPGHPRLLWKPICQISKTKIKIWEKSLMLQPPFSLSLVLSAAVCPLALMRLHESLAPKTTPVPFLLFAPFSELGSLNWFLLLLGLLLMGSSGCAATERVQSSLLSYKWPQRRNTS